jgi:hypothetical protein
MPKTAWTLEQSNTEYFGRCAGVGYAVVGSRRLTETRLPSGQRRMSRV